MDKKDVLITGAAGFVGTQLVKELAANDQFRHVVGIDIVKAQSVETQKGYIYYQKDIREDLSEIMQKYNFDSVIHLATIVSPKKGMTREFLYSVDVLGTENIIDSCIKASVNHIVIISSGASYGYYHDNPQWLAEGDKLRGNPEFAYSDHKRIIEEKLAAFKESHPELKQIILRPGTILGKTVDNQITDMFHKPIVWGIKGSAIPFVFIWDEDFISIIIKSVLEKREGIFNIAGDGVVSLKEIARTMKKPYVQLPYSLMFGAISALKFFKLTQYGPEQIDFLRYRPVLINTALKEELGYIPKKSSKDSFLSYLEAKNLS